MAIIIHDSHPDYILGLDYFKNPLELPQNLQINLHDWISYWDSDNIGMWRTNEIPNKELRESCIRDIITFINQSRLNSQLKVLSSNDQTKIINTYDHMRDWFYRTCIEEHIYNSDNILEQAVLEKNKFIKFGSEETSLKSNTNLIKNMFSQKK